jgi:hypothetical protein
VLTKKGAIIHFAISGIADLEEEESGVTTRELAKLRVAKKNLWIDLKGDSSRESKEPIRLEGHIERSCERISARGPIGLRHPIPTSTIIRY